MTRAAIGRSGALLVATQYVCVAIGLGTTVAASRLLGPAQYGLAALAISFPALLWSFVSVKPGIAATRYLSSLRAEGRTTELAGICRLAFGVDLGASAIILVLAAASSGWVAAHVYRQPAVAWLMVLYGASYCFLSLGGTSRAVLSSWLKFGTLSALDVLDRVVTLVLVLALLWGSPSVTGYVVAMAGANLVVGLVSLWAASRVLAQNGVEGWWRRQGHPLPRALRNEVFGFFGWNYLLLSLSGLVTQVPLILLGRFRGPAEAGYYRLALTLVTVGSYMEIALARVVYPVLCARWATEDRNELRRELRRWTLRSGVPAAVALGAGTLLLPVLLPPVFGAEFSPAVGGMQLMMVGTMVGTVFFWQSSYYQAAGRMAALTRANALYTGFIVGLSALLAGPWGFVGVAAVIGVARALYSLVLLLPMRDEARGAAGDERGAAAARPSPRLDGAVESAR